MRKRKVIKRGDKSYAIALMKSDMIDFDLEVGRDVDISDINVVEAEK